MGLGRFTRKGVELRKSPRERIDGVVQLEFHAGLPSICGTLRDLSATGAQMSLPTLYDVPPRFALVLPPDTRRTCRLIWQSGQRIGVEFTSG
jgi:hypothetical protein